MNMYYEKMLIRKIAGKPYNLVDILIRQFSVICQKPDSKDNFTKPLRRGKVGINILAIDIHLLAALPNRFHVTNQIYFYYGSLYESTRN